MISTPKDRSEKSQTQSSSQLELVPLKLGARGSDVAALQQSLKKFGYDCGLVDGIFGDRTREAVTEVQRHFGLEECGFLDSPTWYALSFWAEEERTSLVQSISIYLKLFFRNLFD